MNTNGYKFYGSGTLRCRQLDAKPTFNSLTFKLLFTNPNPYPNQLPGIELGHFQFYKVKKNLIKN